MRTLFRCFFIVLAGSLLPLSAENFARHIPAGSLLYVEGREMAAVQQRFRDRGAFGDLEDLDWKKLTVQLYQIGLASGGIQTPEEDELTPDELTELLENFEEQWTQIRSHLSGDFAFAIGNFRDLPAVFRETSARRKELQAQALTEGLEGDEELSEEQQALLEARLEEEERLDLQEAGSILGKFQFWIDVQDAPQLEKTLQEWMEQWVEGDPDFLFTRTEAEGARLYALRGSESDPSAPSLNWTLEGNVWIITFTPESLQSAVRAFKTPLENALADARGYQEALDFIGPADIFMYWDVAPLGALIKEALEALPENPAPNPFLGNLPRAGAVLDWLEPSAVLPYSLGTRIEADGIRTRGRYGFTRETALARILTDPDPQPAALPSFLHRDVQQLASVHWHPGKGWTRLETELMGIFPQAAAGMGLVRMLASGQVGFDLKLQLMDHLNGSMLLVQQIDPEILEKMMELGQKGNAAGVMQLQMKNPTGGQNYLLALGLENEAAVREAFDRLLLRFHPEGIPDPETFSEQEIYYPVPDSLQGGSFHRLVSYSFIDGYLLIAVGNDLLLKDAILASGDPQLQLTGQPEFQALRKRFPADALGLEYSSGELQKKAMQLMQASMGMLQAQVADLDLPDLSSLTELFRHAMSVTVRNGWVTEVEGWIEFPAEHE